METARFLRYVLLSIAALFIVTYLILAFFRMGYPFELEWMEGASVDHVIRILYGEKVYVAPSLEFIPFIYTPLYFYVSAILSKIMGVGFFPLRFLSFLSSLGCFLLIFLIVRRETGSKYSGVLASCLFAAVFRISGAWFDIARVDSLFLLFLLGALYLIKFRESAKSYLLTGVLISLSFLTKQTALLICLPLMVYCFFVNRRLFIYLIGPVIIIIGSSTYLLNNLHNGWYNYYVFELPGQHSVVKSVFVAFWTKDIMSPLAITFILSIFYLFAQGQNSNKKNLIFYGLMLIGMLGGAWFSRLHLGGYDNVLIPAYAALSILFGIAAHTAFVWIKTAKTDKSRFLETYLYLICIIQFLVLVYNPLAQVPTQKDLEAGHAFINTLAQLPGEILVPFHGYLPTLAGKRSCAHHQAISDVLRGKDCPAKTELIKEIHQALQEKKFAALILDAPWYWEITGKHYAMQKKVFASEHVFWPVTGMRTRPQFIVVPKSDDIH